jgi:hypothetical protein
MRFRVTKAAFLLVSAAWSQTVSVKQVEEFVRSSVTQKLPDKQVAAYLKKMKLSEKLTESVIEDLQSQGAGPQTVAALKDLGVTTAKLSAPAPPPPPKVYRPIPPPSYEDQQKVLEQVREYALGYTKNLPDYICTKVTRRFYDPTGKGSWRQQDTITNKLTYFEQKEKNTNILVNGQMTEKTMEQLGGTTSQGEFGSLMSGVFEEKSAAEFHWDRWATLRGHRVHVFRYAVDQSHSEWGIYDGDAKQSVVPAYRGEVFVDRDTNEVLRISLEAVDIPADFRVRVATDRLDYDYQDISGHRFLLPYHAEIQLDDNRRFQTKNELDFHFYKKFSADTVLTFDLETPPPLDDSKTKEEPVKEDKKVKPIPEPRQ